jgi:hypothetical protein
MGDASFQSGRIPRASTSLLTGSHIRQPRIQKFPIKENRTWKIVGIQEGARGKGRDPQKELSEKERKKRNGPSVIQTDKRGIKKQREASLPSPEWKAGHRMADPIRIQGECQIGGNQQVLQGKKWNGDQQKS